MTCTLYLSLVYELQIIWNWPMTNNITAVKSYCYRYYIINPKIIHFDIRLYIFEQIYLSFTLLFGVMNVILCYIAHVRNVTIQRIKQKSLVFCVFAQPLQQKKQTTNKSCFWHIYLCILHSLLIYGNRYISAIGSANWKHKTNSWDGVY